MGRHRKDISNQVFHDWTVISYAEGKGNDIKWLCRCKCGTERNVLIRSLRNNVSKSCGCRHDEYVATLRTHGMTKTREFKIWQGMLQRCYNSNHEAFHLYGGRGIQVCERWSNSFEAFFEDMGSTPSKEHTLDRYPNNNGNYEPGNCRWATKKEQGRNTRLNRRLTHDGTTLTVTEWAEKLGIAVPTLFSRLRKGWPLHRALSPVVDETHSQASRHRK